MFDCGVNLLSKRLDPLQVVQQSVNAGLQGLVIIGSDLEESQQAKDFCNRYNSSEFHLRYTAGVHPHSASSWTTEHYARLRSIAKDPLCIAVGECGLDFNRNYSPPQDQELAFIEQLKLANELNKGVYLHERDAFDRQIALLDEYTSGIPFKIAHCFTGNEECVIEYLHRDCFIGITGWVCDQKRGGSLRNAIRKIPLHKMLAETDAPYLFPKTVKPRRSDNSPIYLEYVIAEIAALIGEDADTVKRVTTENALKLFCCHAGVKSSSSYPDH